MSRFLALCFLVVFAAVPLTLTASAADPWTVAQSVGEVSVRAEGLAPVSVEPKQDLPNGATITTGDTGRALIVRGQETIMIAPRSSLVLPAAGLDKTTILQRSGTLIFKVGKRPVAHFEVDTPYLAAIVKGTTFTVSVTESGAAVAVHEGAVEVRTKDSAMSVLTKAGQISRVLGFALGEILTTGILLPSDPAADIWSDKVDSEDIVGESKPAWVKTQGAKLKTASAPSSAARPWEAMRVKTARRVATADIHKTENTNPGTQKAASEEAAPNSADSARTVLTDGWQLTSMHGRVEIGGSTVAPLNPGKPLPVAAGSSVLTGPDGGATLANRRSTIVLAANAQIALPGGVLSVAQAFTHQHGDVQYRIRASGKEAISVAAPFLAVTSKGGTFVVRTSDAQTLVEATSGKADVAPYQGPDSVRLGGDGRAWVLANDPSVIESQGGERRSKYAMDDPRLNALAGMFSGSPKSAQANSAASQTSAMLRRVSYQTVALELPGTRADFGSPQASRPLSPELPAHTSVPSTNNTSKQLETPALNSSAQPAPAAGPAKQSFQVSRPASFSKRKQEEVRSKGLSVLEMGLYALFGLGLAAGGAVWLMKRRQRGPVEPSAQQVRVRSIAGSPG